MIFRRCHFVKNDRIRSFSGPYFHENTEQKNYEYEHFSRGVPIFKFNAYKNLRFSHRIQKVSILRNFFKSYLKVFITEKSKYFATSRF